MTEPSRQQVLDQILTLANANDLTLKDIAAAMRQPTGPKNKATLFLVSIGGIFIIAGISAFITMFWPSMNSPERVIITLGSGFAVFVMGMLAVKDERYRKASEPLLLIAAILEPTGLFVLIDEYFHSGHDARYASLFVSGVMLLQQGFCFFATRRAVLLFFTLVFGTAFFTTEFSLLDISDKWNAVIIGFALLNLAYALSRTDHHGLASFWFFVGGTSFLGGLFAVVEKTAIELLYLAATCFMVFVSTTVRSTALMIVSVVAMLSYIGYYTEEHFVHSIGWPAALILLGLIFLGTGAGAIRLKKKYL
jgi:uncharacterized membrane protein